MSDQNIRSKVLLEEFVYERLPECDLNTHGGNAVCVSFSLLCLVTCVSTSSGCAYFDVCLLALQMPKASLELATGQRFEGFSFGAKAPAAGEVKILVAALLFSIFERGSE